MMAITAGMALRIEQFKETLPPQLNKQDVAYVMAHKVILEQVATNDACCEFSRLDGLIKQFAWRLAYCRYVESCIDQCGEAVAYDEWRESVT